MRLTKISAANIKGVSFTYDLTSAVAIVGPNFSHKTAVIEAIRLALLGYIPEVGKLPRSTWELSSGTELFVMATFDDESELSRRFFYKGATLSMAERGDGVEVNQFADLPLLNAAAYFEMTDGQRTSYVFERVRLPDSYTVEGIIAECERISFEEEHSEAIEKAKTNLIDILRKSSVPASIQEYLTTVLEAFRDLFTYWNKRAKETQGTVKTLTELKLREKECSTDSLRQLETEIAEAQSVLDKLNADKGRLAAQQTEAERVAGRKKQIRKILDEDRVDYDKIIGDLKQKIAGAKIVPVPSKEDREKTKQSLRNLAETISRVDAESRQNEKNIAAAQEQLQHLTELKACPFCKSKGKDWKTNLEKELNQTVKLYTGLCTDGKKYIEDLRDQLVKMSKRAEQDEKDVAANADTLKRIDNWQEWITAKTSEKTQAEKYRADLHEELDGLNILPVGEDLEAQLGELSNRIRAATGIRDGLTVRKKSALVLQQDLKRAAQSQLEHQSAVAHVKVIKAIADVLKGKREAMITVVFGELLAVANKLVEGILPSPLSLYENTVGRWKDAKFIPHRVFSGTEKALTYVAISIALSAQAPLKLVILDEFNRLDRKNQVEVVNRLLDLTDAKIIDQFIVVGTNIGLVDLARKYQTAASRLTIIELK
jgi:DNA repair exonuclease SbcCD ATPase subunit